MTTALESAFRAFVAANPNDPDGGSWNQKCAKGQSRFANFLGGWITSPRLFGPTAHDVALASGPLNGTAADAPIGAYHHFSRTPPGHVVRDLAGGGTRCGSLGTVHGLVEVLAPYAGILNVWDYQAAGYPYIGWSTNYAGGVSHVPAKAPPDPTIRRTVAIGANVRTTPTLTGIKGTPYKGNIDVKFDGFAHGDTTAGSDIWFHNGNGWSHSSGFTSASTVGLSDLTPPPPAPPADEPEWPGEPDIPIDAPPTEPPAPPVPPLKPVPVGGVIGIILGVIAAIGAAVWAVLGAR